MRVVAQFVLEFPVQVVHGAEALALGDALIGCIHFLHAVCLSKLVFFFNLLSSKYLHSAAYTRFFKSASGISHQSFQELTIVVELLFGNGVEGLQDVGRQVADEAR